MRYFKTKYGTIINEKNEVIPMQEGNSLYNEYLEFLSNDGAIEETDFLTEIDLEIQSKELVPQTVTRRQLKQALVLAGIPMSSIDYAISQIADETEKALITIYWNDSTEFERYHPKLVEFAQALQISEEQADQLFILANTL